MILITGATGLVGLRLVPRLTAQGEVVCLIRPGPRVRQFEAGVSVSVVTADVDDLAALRLAMHGVHTIVHLAAISRPNRRHSIEAVNVGGTQNVLGAAHETGVRRIIYVSLIGADTHSAYPYLRSKGQAEEVIRDSGLDYTIIRSSSVYGAGDDWTTAMTMGMHAMPFVFPIPGDGRSRLQPLCADDLVECISRSLYDRSKYNCTMEIGGPQVFSFNDIVLEIMHATGLKRRCYHMREPLARAFSRICERVMGRPPFTQANIDLLSIDRTTTLDAVSHHFGFQPARFAESLGYLTQARPWRRMFFEYLFTRN